MKATDSKKFDEISVARMYVLALAEFRSNHGIGIQLLRVDLRPLSRKGVTVRVRSLW